MTSKHGNRSGKNFSPKTKRDLSERVAYMCSNPYCRKLTIKPNADRNIAVRSGKACHIVSASPKGPRADETKSDEFVKSFKNGIWLCDICAREVDDNQNDYKIEQLLKWKSDAETYVETLVTQDTRLRQLRSLTQTHLSALRILSGLPTRLDQTFENPNGNGINLTRLLIELELVLFDNDFLAEADMVGAIRTDLENVSKFIDDNKTGNPINIWDWKKTTVHLMMINVMRFKNAAYDRFYRQDNSMMEFALGQLASKGVTPILWPLTGTMVAEYLSKIRD
jgi:hypothetical protein